jgi:hypothetical protein
METHGLISSLLPFHILGGALALVFIRIPALLAVAVLLPVVVMVYWLWRLRTRRGLTVIANAERYEASFDINPKGQLS